MPINYSFEITQDLLEVKASGTDEGIESADNYAMATIETAVRHQCKKVLCDERNLDYNLRIADTYKLARHISEVAPKIAQIAIVCNARFSKEISFFEDVTVNRGLNMKGFTEMEEARKWLGV